ncbi:hypothetical protein D3C80_18970 [compost metagenome]
MTLVIIMKKNMLVLAVACAFSFSANAGFFDSKEKEVEVPFKCGRDDAAASLVTYIKDDAASRVNTLYGEKYPKNINEYIKKVDDVAVKVSNISTRTTNDNELLCMATVHISMAPEILELSSQAPDVYQDYIRYSAAMYKDNGLEWKELRYIARLSDNKKDVSISGDVRMQSGAIAKAIGIIADKDQILKNSTPEKLAEAQGRFEKADKVLNEIWKGIPPSFRASMKAEQLAWVEDKARKCGNVLEARADYTASFKRVAIYNCQEKVTNERIKFLGGK